MLILLIHSNLAAIVAAELRAFVKLSIPIYPCITFSSLSPSTVENSDGILLSINTKLWFDLMHLGQFNSHLTTNPLLNPTSRGVIDDPLSFPKTHVITAELDILRDEGLYYVKYLQNNGVRVSHTQYNGTIHGFFGNSIFTHGRDALFAVCALIKNSFSEP